MQIENFFYFRKIRESEIRFLREVVRWWWMMMIHDDLGRDQRWFGRTLLVLMKYLLKWRETRLWTKSCLHITIEFSRVMWCGVSGFLWLVCDQSWRWWSFWWFQVKKSVCSEIFTFSTLNTPHHVVCSALECEIFNST